MLSLIYTKFYSYAASLTAVRHFACRQFMVLLLQRVNLPTFDLPGCRILSNTISQVRIVLHLVSPPVRHPDGRQARS